MRLSRYFLPILKENPGDAQVESHRLMLRSGMIQQTASGVYIWLPLGLRVLDKIAHIIRDEQTRAGAIEILMPTTQLAQLWETSGRYASYGEEMLRFKDRHGRDMLYGPTNEEVVTQLFARSVTSYKDLPLNLFHVQWKFRDEVRPRFGVMRAREFLMKDAYSFDLDEEGARLSYQKMFVSYLRIFHRLGVQAIPVKADTGPIGGDLSHEFIIIAPNGESDIFYDANICALEPPSEQAYISPAETVSAFTRPYACTQEQHDPQVFAALPKERRVATRGIEVGHVFYFGDKYARPFGARVHDAAGQERVVQMGSYGIGVSRLVGALAEVFNDKFGLCWPMAIAPFHVGLLNLRPGQEALDALCDRLYHQLQENGLEVLYDDTPSSVGRKRATMDLIGLPWQIIVGPEGLKEGFIEYKNRATGDTARLPVDAALPTLLSTIV